MPSKVHSSQDIYGIEKFNKMYEGKWILQGAQVSLGCDDLQGHLAHFDNIFDKPTTFCKKTKMKVNEKWNKRDQSINHHHCVQQ